jgi:hypothetical protein
VSFLVTADPTTAFADAVKAILSADSVLDGLVEGVFGHLSETDRTTYPYVVLGRSSADGNAGAMGLNGSALALQIDAWSDAKGPYEAEQIQSRIFVLLERRPGFSVSGFTPIMGSLHREFAEIFDEPDEDKPGERLYHSTQRWTCELHESQ